MNRFVNAIATSHSAGPTFASSKSINMILSFSINIFPLVISKCNKILCFMQ